jgi:tetraacyldisaccharide 4'-kinase
LCFNEKQLLGNGLTLPSGPLRESASGVKNSKLIIINGKKNIKFERKIKEFSNKIKIFYSNYIPINYGKFKNKKLIAFAGIGNPENFFSLLKQCKLDVKKKVSFPDHYLYTKKDLKNLRALSKRNNCELITTEKDYFRIKNLGYGNINFLLIKLKILKKLELIEELKKYI